jgi:hypothetical protein
MRVTRFFLIAGIVAGLASPAAAQSRFDVGFLIGPTFATNEAPALEFGQGTTYELAFAWHVWRGREVMLSFELPFIASPAFTTRTPGAALPKEYATAFVTPAIRATWFTDRPISVFGSIGGGYARYSESKLREDNGPNPQQLDTNTGALEFGGGVDVRGPGWVSFRGEVRDVVTGVREFSIPTPGNRVHNVSVSGGLVVRF